LVERSRATPWVVAVAPVAALWIGVLITNFSMPFPTCSFFDTGGNASALSYALKRVGIAPLPT